MLDNEIISLKKVEVYIIEQVYYPKSQPSALISSLHRELNLHVRELTYKAHFLIKRWHIFFINMPIASIKETFYRMKYRF